MPGMATPAPPDPLARLRFARWLVETGRLSEWPDAHHRNGVVRVRLAALDPTGSSAAPEDPRR
jgi:hypothetical protein